MIAPLALLQLLGCFPSDDFFREQCLRAGGNWQDGSCISDTALGFAAIGFDPDAAYAFVTTRTMPGNIAQLGDDGQTAHQVADDICTIAAMAGGVPGTFRAWLSTSDLAAVDHIEGDGPWLSTRGDELFPNAGALRGTAQSTDWRDEFGKDIGRYDPVWTGTALGGGLGFGTCRDWTSLSSGDSGTIGEPALATDEWTDGAPNPCDTVASLLCFSTTSR